MTAIESSSAKAPGTSAPTSVTDKIVTKKDNTSNEVFALLHGQEQKEQIQQAIGSIAQGLSRTEDMIGNSAAWMHEWIDGINGDSVSREALKKEVEGGGVQYDVSIFGPPLKKQNDERGAEINKLLLSKESDFTDALVNIDHDNFLGDPYDCSVRNNNVAKRLVGDIYSTVREVYLSLPLEMAMQRMHYYRQSVRTYRSCLYITQQNQEQMDIMQMKLEQLEALKEKYEATIYTLRRQLQDFHGASNTVGRGVDGKFGAVGGPAAAAVGGAAAGIPGLSVEAPPGQPAKPKHPYVVIVQLEDLSAYRSRHRQLCENTLWVGRDCVTNLAHGFQLTRTNFLEQKEDPSLNNGKKVAPPCFMFTCDDAYNAVAYAIELHQELARSEEWPKPLLDMTKFSTAPWRGLRLRVGIHTGPLATMELSEPSRINHYEGVPVEKTMRITDLGLAGDTVISHAAWECYQEEQKNGLIPASKRYVSLRAMITENFHCAKKPGFKKGEIAHKTWHKELQERKDDPLDCDFGHIAFWKLEASSRDLEDEDDGPTTEDLLAAKDTELTLMQQELDGLQLAVMKRDSDLDEMQGRMLYAISKLQKGHQVKTVYLENLVSLLENQNMFAADDFLKKQHDEESRRRSSLASTLGEPSPFGFSLVSPGVQSVKESEERRRKLFEGMGFIETVESDQEGGEDGNASPRPGRSARRESVAFTAPEGGEGSVRKPTKKGSGKKKHKNQKLWRELKSMVGTNNKKVVEKRSLQRQGSVSGRYNSMSGASLLMFRFHSTFRVYSALMKRYVIEGDANDQDNQSISEDQFIQLFMAKVNEKNESANGGGTGLNASPREALNLMASAAIEDGDVEEANSKDAGRLVRSCGGHLAKILRYVGRARNKAQVVLHQAKAMETKYNEELEKLNASKKKKGGKKGSAADGNEGSLSVGGGGAPPSRTPKSTSLTPASTANPPVPSSMDKTLQRENEKLLLQLEKLKNELHTQKQKTAGASGSSLSAGPGAQRRPSHQGKLPELGARSSSSGGPSSTAAGAPGATGGKRGSVTAGRRGSLRELVEKASQQNSGGSNGGAQSPSNSNTRVKRTASLASSPSKKKQSSSSVNGDGGDGGNNDQPFTPSSEAIPAVTFTASADWDGGAVFGSGGGGGGNGQGSVPNTARSDGTTASIDPLGNTRAGPFEGIGETASSAASVSNPTATASPRSLPPGDVGTESSSSINPPLPATHEQQQQQNHDGHPIINSALEHHIVVQEPTLARITQQEDPNANRHNAASPLASPGNQVVITTATGGLSSHVASADDQPLLLQGKPVGSMSPAGSPNIKSPLAAALNTSTSSSATRNHQSVISGGGQTQQDLMMGALTAQSIRPATREGSASVVKEASPYQQTILLTSGSSKTLENTIGASTNASSSLLRPSGSATPGEGSLNVNVKSPRSLLPPPEVEKPEHDPVVAEGFSEMENRNQNLKEKWAKERAERQQQSEARVKAAREEKERQTQLRKERLAARASASRSTNEANKARVAGIIYAEDPGATGASSSNPMDVLAQHTRPHSPTKVNLVGTPGVGGALGDSGGATGSHITTTTGVPPPPQHPARQQRLSTPSMNSRLMGRQTIPLVQGGGGGAAESGSVGVADPRRASSTGLPPPAGTSGGGIPTAGRIERTKSATTPDPLTSKTAQETTGSGGVPSTNPPLPQPQKDQRSTSLHEVGRPISKQQQRPTAGTRLEEPLAYVGNTFQVQNKKQLQEQMDQEAKLKEQLKQLRQLQEMQFHSTNSQRQRPPSQGAGSGISGRAGGGGSLSAIGMGASSGSSPFMGNNSGSGSLVGGGPPRPGSVHQQSRSQVSAIVKAVAQNNKGKF